jgi:branched-chain amino acid transport system ATP-binding protein
MTILEVSGLTKKFGGIVAIDRLDLSIQENEIYGLIGPNGAGKSTFFNLLSGFYNPDEGKINMRGRDLLRLAPYQRCRVGMARTFQAPTIAEDLTVIENVRVSQHFHYFPKLLSCMLNGAGWRKTEGAAKKRAVEILESLGISSLANEQGAILPHGIKRRLQIAIALGSEPDIILLDEVTSGMEVSEKTDVMNFIRSLAEKGISCVVIEHDMNFIKSVCDRIAVLNFGKKIADGLAEEVINNREVVKAYLGEEDA